MFEASPSNEIAYVAVASRMKEQLNTRNWRCIFDQVASQISLCVQIKTKALQPSFFTDASQQPRCVRFANSTFQIQNRDDFRPTIFAELHAVSVARIRMGVELTPGSES
jgi:hypothetical protein